ncbi:SUKH-3 domain-containing protein [Streptomyces sp. I05A-00742]|uniref:SUKH-3 domain-containing protein n=1 Tax=Streptomyces sp. I05A-00742 TaxID=2732853 RepID=UPI001488E11C|nr:SUKH-3 domain-containing protein [Streptomyces sp. I05A-00742]
MSTVPPSEEVGSWLAAHGWFEGRDAGSEVEVLIEARIRDFREQGETLSLLATAEAFLRSYGKLELPISETTGVRLILDPTGGYDEDAEDIVELANDLGQRLFPVGYETYEGGILLVDEVDRFFYLHHSGSYFLGEGALEMFANRLGGRTVAAEEFYV